jgi:hypothetical protein
MGMEIHHIDRDEQNEYQQPLAEHANNTVPHSNLLKNHTSW